MESVVRFSLKQRVFYNLMFVVLIVAGFLSLFSMPAERYPNFSFGEVIISTSYPGASPTEVEALITRKIEEALEAVEDIEWIQATSFRERSHIRLKFIDDTDYDALFDEVRFHLLNIIGELPEGIDPPQSISAKVSDFLPVIMINLTGNHDNRALALMAEQLKSTLLHLPGVQQVELSGDYIQEFHLYLDPARMRRLGVSYDQVAQALESSNRSLPAGDFVSGSGQILIKVDEKFQSRQQVLDSIIRSDADGSLVRVADVISHAGLGYRDPLAITSVNGENAVALKITKSDAGNALKIKRQIMQQVDAFKPILDQHGVKTVFTQDSTVYIEDGLSTLGMNMGVGIILVSLIIWYFMGIRNAGLVTIGIPFSFMITLLIMYLTGNSFNEITLFAFVLVTGIVVDDAIVVTENIYRYVQQGEPLKKAIIKGTAEVALPVISATLTTVAAFLPMLIMTGATGQFFALIPKAVTFALFASLVECLLILPIHYFDFGPRRDHNALELERDNALLRLLRRLTSRVLKFTLRFRLLSLSLVLGLFLSALAILGLSITGKAPLIKIQFFPDDYKLYYVDLFGPTATPIEKIDEILKQISRTIMADGPSMAAATTGMAGLYFNDDYEPVYGNNYGSVMVTMPSLDDQSFDDPLAHLDNMRSRLKQQYERDGYTLRIHPQADGPPTGKDINVRVLGSDPQAIEGLADELLTFMRQEPKIGPHLVELASDQGQPKQVLRFEVLHDRVAEYGLDSAQVARLAASVLDGRYIGKYRLSDDEIDLKLRIDSSSLQHPEDALDIPLIEHASSPIRLGDLTRVQRYNETGEINRYQGQRAISIKANIKPGAPTSTPAVVKRVNDYYETVRSRYPGVSVTFGGEHEDTQRSYESLAYAFIIAVMAMYLILATQFQSYLQPLIILSAIVFALIGVVFGKMVSQTLFTINSFIAVIGVAGVVVNDALVLIDFINRRYRSGMSRRQAVEEGVHIRLRPIVLTTLTTTLGLLPMALGIPSYSLVWGTMASTFVAGLATATALTLFIVPVQWDLLQGMKERRQRRRETAESG